MTGLLVPHDDTDALANALLHLSGNPGQVETMGRAARGFAERFSWEETVSQTEAHLIETVRAGRQDKE